MPSYLQAVCLALLLGQATALLKQEPAPKDEMQASAHKAEGLLQQDEARPTLKPLRQDAIIQVKSKDEPQIKVEQAKEAAEDLKFREAEESAEKAAEKAKVETAEKAEQEAEEEKAQVEEDKSSEVAAEKEVIREETEKASEGTTGTEVELCPNGRMPAYIMSLNSRYDRWERASVRFMGLSLLDPSLCIEVERSPATNGAKDPIPLNMVTKAWSTDRNRNYVGNGTWYDKVEKELQLTPGERGCAASHIRLWKKIAKMDTPVIIVEDDAVPKKEFAKSLKKAMEEVPSDADLLYLGYSRPDKAPWRSLIGTSLAEVDYVWTTVGYIIWPKGARKLLQRLPIDSPVDNFMSWASHTNHTKVYALQEPAITQELPWSVLNDVKHSDEISKNKAEREEFRKQVTLFTRPFREAQQQFTQQMNAAILGLDTLDSNSTAASTYKSDTSTDSASTEKKTGFNLLTGRSTDAAGSQEKVTHPVVKSLLKGLSNAILGDSDSDPKLATTSRATQ